MRLSTLSLLICSFTLGFLIRPKGLLQAPSGEITFTHDKPRELPQGEIVAGRMPSSLERQIQEAAAPIRQTINGVDVVQSMLNKDMAQVFAVQTEYEKAWLNQFLYSRFQQTSQSERDDLEVTILKDAPLKNDEAKRIYRGQVSFAANGKKVWVDVVMSVKHEAWKTWSSGDDGAPAKSFDRPCLYLDGYLTTGKLVERLYFDQPNLCSRKFLQQDGNGYIGLNNYQRPSGAVVSLLLFPANPEARLPLEFLPAGSADWQQAGDWSWRSGTEADYDEMWGAMFQKSNELGLPTENLHIPFAE